MRKDFALILLAIVAIGSIAIVALVGGVHYFGNKNSQSQVRVTGIGTFGTGMSIGGTGFTKDNNYIRFNDAYSKGLSSPDGVSLLYNMSDNLVSGCGYPNLAEPSGTVHCTALVYTQLNSGSYNISVVNANGESNKTKLKILLK